MTRKINFGKANKALKGVLMGDYSKFVRATMAQALEECSRAFRVRFSSENLHYARTLLSERGTSLTEDAYIKKCASKIGSSSRRFDYEFRNVLYAKFTEARALAAGDLLGRAKFYDDQALTSLYRFRTEADAALLLGGDEKVAIPIAKALLPLIPFSIICLKHFPSAELDYLEICPWNH